MNIEDEILNNPDNDQYDITFITKRGNRLAVFRERGQFNVVHVEIIAKNLQINIMSRPS
jgi:hypothetical protein